MKPELLAPAGSPEALRAAVDQALEELREDGTLGKISVKYFGSDLSKGE